MSVFVHRRPASAKAYSLRPRISVLFLSFAHFKTPFSPEACMYRHTRNAHLVVHNIEETQRACSAGVDGALAGASHQQKGWFSY